MKKGGFLNSLDIYLSIWMLASVLKFTNHSGILTVCLYTVVILWSFSCAFLLHQKKVTNFIIVLDVLIAMFSIYGIILLLSNDTIRANGVLFNNRVYLLNIYYSLLPFYTFYYYTFNKKITLNKIYFWAIPFFITSYLDYNYQYEFALSKYASGYGISDDVVNNGSYSILALLPLVCLFKNKTLQIIALIPITVLIATAFKRGPMIILTCFFLYYGFMNINSKKKFRWALIILPLAIFVGVQYFLFLYADNLLFEYRVDQTLEGYSSGRDSIVSKLLDYYLLHSNIIQLLFGFGANSTAKYLGNLAHSDWIEILFCHGLMGVIIYGLYWFNIIRCWVAEKNGTNEKLALGTFVIIYFLASIFSMSYSEVIVYASLVFAYLAAKTETEKILVHSKRGSFSYKRQ